MSVESGPRRFSLYHKKVVIVPKLDAKVVNLGKNLQVLGYASGKTIVNFIQIIDNGMYALSLKEGKGAANLDSDNDNEIIGQVGGDDDTEKVDGDVQEVYELSLASWDPFDSADAPEDYIFFGSMFMLFQSDSRLLLGMDTQHAVAREICGICIENNNVHER